MQHESLAVALSAREADIYACGALIADSGYAHDAGLLSGYARKFSMIVLLANFAAETGGWRPAGKSAIWASGGELVVAAEGTEQALVIARKEATDWRGEILLL